MTFRDIFTVLRAAREEQDDALRHLSMQLAEIRNGGMRAPKKKAHPWVIIPHVWGNVRKKLRQSKLDRLRRAQKQHDKYVAQRRRARERRKRDADNR